MQHCQRGLHAVGRLQVASATLVFTTYPISSNLTEQNWPIMIAENMVINTCKKIPFSKFRGLMPAKWPIFLDFANSRLPLKKYHLFRENGYQRGIHFGRRSWTSCLCRTHVASVGTPHKSSYILQRNLTICRDQLSCEKVSSGKEQLAAIANLLAALHWATRWAGLKPSVLYVT